MIEPTKSDIGRLVVYRAWHNRAEQGVITSFSDTAVFVRYGPEQTSKATMRHSLEWVAESHARKAAP